MFLAVTIKSIHPPLENVQKHNWQLQKGSFNCTDVKGQRFATTNNDTKVLNLRDDTHCMLSLPRDIGSMLCLTVSLPKAIQ